VRSWADEAATRVRRGPRRAQGRCADHGRCAYSFVRREVAGLARFSSAPRVGRSEMPDPGCSPLRGFSTGTPVDVPRVARGGTERAGWENNRSGGHLARCSSCLPDSWTSPSGSKHGNWPVVTLRPRIGSTGWLRRHPAGAVSSRTGVPQSRARGAGNGAPSRAFHDQIDTTGLGSRSNTRGVDMTMKTCGTTPATGDHHRGDRREKCPSARARAPTHRSDRSSTRRPIAGRLLDGRPMRGRAVNATRPDPTNVCGHPISGPRRRFAKVGVVPLRERMVSPARPPRRG
jgi:hypothetical protein